MGSVVFTDSYSTSIAGYATYDIRISYSESYSISTNKSTVEITAVELRKQGNSINWGSLPFFGDIKVNGTTLISMDGGSSVRVSLSGDGYCSVAIPSSGSVDVSHNSDGTGSFTMQLVGGFSYSGDDYFCALYQGSPSQPFGVAETSKSVSLTTRPRASSVSVSNGYFGSNVPITISRHASSFTHTVKVSCAGYSQTLMTKGSTYPTVNWTPAVATYAPRITTAMSATATVTCETYSGSTLVGTSTATCTLTLRAADVAPAVSIATTDPQGYLSTYGRYVKSKSKIKVTLTNTLRHGATLALTQITANGSTYNSSPATTDVIASASNTSVTAKITDSRGQTATASKTIAIYDYTTPQINSFSVHRCNSDGTLNNSGAYMRVDYKVTVTALGNNNSKSLTLKYKKVSASSYTSRAITLSSYTQTGEVHNIAADVNSSYNVQLVLSDDFTSTTSTLTLPTASTRINWKSGENGGIAFGKVSEYDKTLEIADDWTVKSWGNIYVERAGDAYVSAKNSSTGNIVYLDTGSDHNHGIYSAGYLDSSNVFHSAPKWIVYRTQGGDIRLGSALGIADGGTGATYAAAARTNLGAIAMPTVIVKNATTSSSSADATYTVSGSGVVIVFAGMLSDDTSDYGTFQSRIYYDGSIIMGEGTRWGSALNYMLGASTAVPIAVSNGKKIRIYLLNTKNGTKYVYRRFLCFGCTVS